MSYVAGGYNSKWLVFNLHDESQLSENVKFSIEAGRYTEMEHEMLFFKPRFNIYGIFQEVTWIRQTGSRMEN